MDYLFHAPGAPKARRSALRAILFAFAAFALSLLLVGCGGRSDPGGPQIPIVLTQPADQSVVEGGVGSFRVIADGAAPLVYQWSSSPDGITFTAIAGATDASYSTRATLLAQSSTRYRVTVSNGVGSVTSSTVRLTVTPSVVAPSITVQPADVTVSSPGATAFHVTATGTALSYQWQVSSDAGATFSSLAGGNASSLVLAIKDTAQSGQRYRVLVSNSAGSVMSTAALLTVSPLPAAPMFATQPVSQAIVAGQAVDFSVAAAGTPTPSIQWRLNGNSVANGAQASGACAGAGVAGATSTTLTLTAVPIGCGGAIFGAVASNGVSPDAISNDATLTVNPAPMAPVITMQPADASVQAPATATFTAAAGGVPSPTVQWQQSTDAGATWANINGATNPSYITPATAIADNAKRFRAVFTNGSGSVNSNAAVLTVTATASGGLSLLAGDVGGRGNFDGTGSAARFDFPEGVAVDSSGNVYVADTINQTIRKITPTGVVSTLAGSPGNSGSTDDTGSAARFSYPQAVAVDAAGNVYVADTFNQTVRKITPGGVVSTLAGSAGSEGSADGAGSAARFSTPLGIAVDAAGNVYISDTYNHTIRKITPAGDVNTLAGSAGNPGSADGPGNAAQFNNPTGVAVDAAGNVYVADLNNQTIRRITPAGVVSTLAGSAGNGGSTDGTGSAARFTNPTGVAVDVAGNVYVADLGNLTIRKITPAGVVSTLAGSPGSQGSADGIGNAAQFNNPTGVAVDATSNVYVADLINQTIRKITPAGVVSTLAGLASNFGSTDGTGSAARFYGPLGVADDSAGNVYVADFINHTIRKITPAGVVNTLAGLAGSLGSTDGTGSAARFRNPQGVATDAAGNVYVADTYSQTIRKITPAGVVSTLAGSAGNPGSTDGIGSAAQFSNPQGVAVDVAGNVYVADTFNQTIRKITPAGVVSTLAGLAGNCDSTDGTGRAARFCSPQGVGVDASGSVYVADSFFHTIRKITPAGVVSTLAGSAGNPGSNDGTGSAASFNRPQGVAVDAASNVYVADTSNATIRKITPDGTVSTVVGAAGEAGIRLGVGGRLSYPQGVAVIGANRLAITSANAVLIADLP